jgi:hypothetical protein
MKKDGKDQTAKKKRGDGIWHYGGMPPYAHRDYQIIGKLDGWTIYELHDVNPASKHHQNCSFYKLAFLDDRRAYKANYWLTWQMGKGEPRIEGRDWKLMKKYEPDLALAIFDYLEMWEAIK